MAVFLPLTPGTGHTVDTVVERRRERQEEREGGRSGARY